MKRRQSRRRLTKPPGALAKLGRAPRALAKLGRAPRALAKLGRAPRALTKFRNAPRALARRGRAMRRWRSFDALARQWRSIDVLERTEWMFARGDAPVGADLQRPPIRLFLNELRAAMTERRPHWNAQDFLDLPHGDGHAVLVLPAFLSGDGRTRPLRVLLERLGYVSAGWGLGVNLGPTDRAIAGIADQLLELATDSGARVSLIGHSLGGVFARALAQRYPEQVRRVITLCSPFRLPTRTNVGPIYRLLNRLHSADAAELARGLAEPPQVPTTAIYTRRDGIVAWGSTRDAAIAGGAGLGREIESIEVPGAHTTMAINPAALRVIADRLARPDRSEENWGAASGRGAAATW